MSSDNYLQGILQREAVDTSATSAVLKVANGLMPIIKKWGNRYLLGVRPSGSFAKGTANRSGTDIDLFLSLHEQTPDTLKEIYDKLGNAMKEAGYTARRQNVSIKVKVDGYDVDLVPAKRQSAYTTDHSLYRRRAVTWTKTNIDKHISVVRGARISDEARILKLWRDQNGLDFPSFYLEMTLIEAIAGKPGTLSQRVVTALEYLRDSFVNARFVDPANGANVISDDLTAAEKRAVSAFAKAALAGPWEGLVK
jgi:Nucleotidyltransferase domain